MGAKPLNKYNIVLDHPISSWTRKDGWTKEKIPRWVTNAGGTVQPQFDENTTHLVADENAWRNKSKKVQLALAAIDEGRKVFIVSPDWLENCLHDQKKCRESAYLWEKLAPLTQSGKQKKRSKLPVEEDDVEGGRSHQAMMKEVFDESTEKHLNEHDRKALEDQIAGEERVRKELEEAEAKRKAVEKEELEKKRREHAAVMRRTAKKGRGEEFMESNHIYKDSTGFEYDITLTKVDTRVNSNQRCTLTIFESNALPHTYGTNAHFAGTVERPRNNILVGLGTNLATALRMWRLAFREQTGIDWDDRIKAHNERVRAKQLRAESGPFNETRGEDQENVLLADRKFEYMPPVYGPKGLLPNGKDEEPEFVRRKRREDRSKGNYEQVERWMMSGANGSGPNEAIDLTEDEEHAGNPEPNLVNGGDSGLSSNAMEPARGMAGMDEGAAINSIEPSGAADKIGGADAMAGMQEWLDQTQPFDAENLLDQPSQFSFDQVSSFEFDDASAQQQQFDFDQDEATLGGDEAPAPATSSQHNAESIQFGTDENAATNNDDQGAEAGFSFLDSVQQFLEAHEGAHMGGLPAETPVGQTQFAVDVGDEFLNFLNAKQDSNTAGGEVGFGPVQSAVDEWQESSMLDTFGGAESALGKRKREGDSEGLEVDEKKFADESAFTSGDGE